MESSIANRPRKLELRQSYAIGSNPGTHVWGVTPDAADARSPLWQLAKLLWAKKWIIIGGAIFGGLLTGFAGFSRTNLYEANAELIVEMSDSSPGGIVNPDTVTQIVDDHLTLLASQAQLRRVISLLRQSDNSTLIALQNEAAMTGMLSTASAILGSWTAWVRHLFEESKPTAAVPEDPDAPTLGVLENGLLVGQELRSRVVRVGFIDSDPELAALVVNHFVHAYIDYLTEQNRLSIQHDLTAVNDSIPEIQKELARAVKEKESYLLSDALGVLAPDAANRLSRLHVLDMQLDAAATRYNEMLARRDVLIQRAKVLTAGVTTVSPAWPPADPRSITPIYFIPPGMILFGLLVAIIIVVRHNLDERIRNEPQLEDALGIPSAGILPKCKRYTPKYLQRLIVEQPESPYWRAATSILISLAQRIDPWRRQILLVTTVDADGSKTGLAWTLAFSATRLRQRVLFVDFDRWRGPSHPPFANEFSNGKKPGTLADLIEKSCTLNEAIERIPGTEVDYLVSAADSVNIFAQLPTANIRQSIEKLSSEYNLVILNGPAIATGPEVRLLADWTDDVLFTIQWGVTRPQLARTALKLLGMNGVPSYTVWGVLTQVNLRKQKRLWLGDTGDLLRTVM